MKEADDSALASTHIQHPLTRTSGVLGRLDIPALHLSLPINSGIEAQSLRTGLGHIPGSALPGGLGNIALAGHRDTFLRPLRDIRPGMHIFASEDGVTYEYVVRTTEIVAPTDVRVLKIGNRPELTLITCFPFVYVGPAPRRFVVHADLMPFQAGT